MDFFRLAYNSKLKSNNEVEIDPIEFLSLITEKLKIASDTIDIKVLDHLIITEKAYFSFADENLL